MTQGCDVASSVVGVFDMRDSECPPDDRRDFVLSEEYSPFYTSKSSMLQTLSKWHSNRHANDRKWLHLLITSIRPPKTAYLTIILIIPPTLQSRKQEVILWTLEHVFNKLGNSL